MIESRPGTEISSARVAGTTGAAGSMGGAQNPPAPSSPSMRTPVLSSTGSDAANHNIQTKIKKNPHRRFIIYKGDTSTHAQETDLGGASRASDGQEALWLPVLTQPHMGKEKPIPASPQG